MRDADEYAPAMNRTDFRFLERLRVRWAEVDLQKIVFNGHYLMYFDTAVAGYWRALAMPYHETMAQLQGDMFVRKATLEYLGSARYDEQLHVAVRCARIGNSSMNFVAAVFRGNVLLVHGELIYVFADPDTQTSQPVPASLRAVLEGFEAGQAMLSPHHQSWPAAAVELQALRQTVFVDELGLPAALLHTEPDINAMHVLMRNRFGVAVGSARLLPSNQGASQVGMVATLPSLRGAGVGAALLAEVVDIARQRGDHRLWLHARPDAAAFFARQGFVSSGQTVEEAGVLHQVMQRQW
jgi:YbgC/YbaW family acyl-CoA thioester hydrolase